MKRLSEHEQRDLLRLLEAGTRVHELQGRPILDYLRDHFAAERAERNRIGAALVLVRSIAEQSLDPVVGITAQSAVDLLEGGVDATRTTSEGNRD